MATPTFNNYIY